MAQPLRTLLVGVDHPHGPLWRTSLWHHPGFEVVAAIDGHPVRAARLLAREGRELPLGVGLADAIEQHSPDTAVVAMPNDATPGAIAALAGAGIPMIVEKPCAISAAAFAPALEAVRVAGVPFLPAYLRRFSPVASAMRDLIADGTIGEPVSAEITYATANVAIRNAAYLAGLTIEEVRARASLDQQRPDSSGVHWLFERARSGGGVMHWLGVHWLDLLRMVTGEEVAAVSATLATRTDVPVDVEDAASVSLALRSGALATVSCAYALPSGPDRARVAVYGTGGWIGWDGSSPELAVSSHLPSWSAEPERTLRFPVEDRPGYAGALGWATLDAFHAAVTEARRLPVGAEDATRILGILDAIHRSHRDGHRVSIEP